MKWLIKQFKNICNRCHGMGYSELPNGDTKECEICKGRGVL